MPITAALALFNSKAVQCDTLIANAHRADVAGNPLFPALDREQITIAAFLNLYVAWEEFLESAFGAYLTGMATLSGALPVRYATPPTTHAATRMLVGINRYFDFANHTNVRKVAAIYFQDGYPFDAPISAILGDLDDMRTMRNSSAHISSTTQIALESLAQRIFGAPRPGVSLYSMLTSVDPRSSVGGTVYAESRDKLLAAATLIANG